MLSYSVAGFSLTWIKQNMFYDIIYRKPCRTRSQSSTEGRSNTTENHYLGGFKKSQRSYNHRNNGKTYEWKTHVKLM